MPASGFIVLVLVLLVTCEAEPATEFIEASDGGSASLPCNLSPPGSPDKISVVLWYKGAEQSPIYKYDVRGNQPVRWAEPSLQNRYFLRILDDHRAVMTITPTKLSDEQMFHCKVDFLKSSTRITHVNLTIIVPPSGVQVSDDWGSVKNGITTAYAEGASLTLTCVASSGKPLARVSWWRDGTLVTDETENFSDRRKSQSVLKIDKLARTHLLAIYSCEASNSRLQPPLVVRTAIDMYLRPLEVTLIGNNPEFSTGKRYNITCRCRGSRPPAIITWWKGHDTTSSAIGFAMYCLSTNPDIQEKAVQEQKIIFEDCKNAKTTVSHLHEMKYLELIIKESLRLYPSVPILGRTLCEDVEWGGMLFPKRLNVFIPIYAIHRNPEFFDNPDEFRPERFLESNISNHFTYIPFSAGPRNCIGQKFAILEIKCILSKVLRSFELLPATPKQELLLVADVVLESANGICIALKKRKLF